MTKWNFFSTACELDGIDKEIKQFIFPFIILYLKYPLEPMNYIYWMYEIIKYQEPEKQTLKPNPKHSPHKPDL